MEFVEIPGFGERFTFPENVEITINGDAISTVRQAAVRMAERWEEAVVCEIVKEARVAGYTEVTVLNKEAILETLRRYLTAPKTNADRIRSMTDEELAEFLCKINGCYQENCPGAMLCKFGGGLANGLKKWLQQPAEEGTP
jgi:hypothetical protein